MKSQLLLKLLRFWPPYLGAGVRVVSANQSLTEILVEMKLSPWNKNYVGTQFGGSLYSMVDPFYMLMLMENLGRDYIVWDKAASIRFKKPGKGKVTAKFHLTPERLGEIRKAADTEEKTEPNFHVEILDETNEVVATVEKLLYIKRKDKVHSELNK